MSLINENLIQIQAELEDRDAVINEIAKMLYKEKRTHNVENLIQDILKREAELSTSLGFGVAIPHAHSEYVSEPSLVFIKLSNKISWGSDDNIEVIFGIANPSKNNSDNHLKILAMLSRKLMDDEFRNKFTEVRNKEDAVKLLSFLNDDIQ